MFASSGIWMCYTNNLLFSSPYLSITTYYFHPHTYPSVVIPISCKIETLRSLVMLYWFLSKSISHWCSNRSEVKYPSINTWGTSTDGYGWGWKYYGVCVVCILLTLIDPIKKVQFSSLQEVFVYNLLQKSQKLAWNSVADPGGCQGIHAPLPRPVNISHKKMAAELVITSGLIRFLLHISSYKYLLISSMLINAPVK